VLFTTDYLSSVRSYIATGHHAYMYILKGDEYFRMPKKLMCPENENGKPLLRIIPYIFLKPYYKEKKLLKN
jgi:hypothetical protein